MSLDFDVGKVTNHTVITSCVFNANDPENRKVKWWHRTQSLVWLCLSVDMQGITESNWKEFYKRVNIYQKMVNESKPEDEITPLEVFMHIGLATNVVTKPFGEWMAKVSKLLDEDNKNEYINAGRKYLESNLASINEAEWQIILDREGNSLDSKLHP